MFVNHINKRGLTFIELLIIIGILGTLIALAIPSRKSCGRSNARLKSCFSNQRVLAGAVEMYNMDVEEDNMMHVECVYEFRGL